MSKFIDVEAEVSGEENVDQEQEEADHASNSTIQFLDDANEFPNAPEPVHLQQNIESFMAPMPPVSHRLALEGVEPGDPTTRNKRKAKDDWVMPVDRCLKRITQIVEAHLPGAIAIGRLTHNLVTIIPDINAREDEIWPRVNKIFADLVRRVRGLNGVYASVITVEVHPGSSKKKKQNPKSKDEEALGEEDIVDPNAEVTPEKPRGKLAGLPHFHILLYYRKQDFPQKDLSLFKQILLRDYPMSDVHQRALVQLLARSRVANGTPSAFIKALSYVLKSYACPAKLAMYTKYLPAECPPPLPAFVHGKIFGIDAEQLATDEVSQRFYNLLSALAEHCTPSFELADGLVYDNSEFSAPTVRHKSVDDLELLARIFEKEQIFVAANDKDFYERGNPINFGTTKYSPLRTFRRIGDLKALRKRLDDNAFAQAILVQYADQVRTWFEYKRFPHLAPCDYKWVELYDAYYDRTTGTYCNKDEPLNEKDQNLICFRAYDYTRAESECTLPRRTIRMWESMQAPPVMLRVFNEKTKQWEKRLKNPMFTLEQLKLDLALLLRPRKPRQPAPFFKGSTLSCKTTIFSFLLKFYPVEALGFVNDSSAGLSGISEETAFIFCDEFETSFIPRHQLLILLDGAQPIQVRGLHQSYRQIEHRCWPVGFASNFMPKYKEDDSQALENRINLYILENSFKRNEAIQQEIFDEHFLTVCYLNRWLNARQAEAQ